MRKKLSKILLATLLSASVAQAASNDYVFESSSLVGLEVGMSSFEVKDNVSDKKEDFAAAGLKIGAESRNVRLFLSARNGFMSSDNYDYDTSYIYGAEFQYLFNFAEFGNFFIGVNAGRASFEFDDLTSAQRKYTTDYLGADVGFNFHIGKSFDIEVGGRLMTLDEPNHTLGGVTYTFDDIVTGYTSLIFKYQMD